jgi:hypothetical protein
MTRGCLPASLWSDASTRRRTLRFSNRISRCSCELTAKLFFARPQIVCPSGGLFCSLRRRAETMGYENHPRAATCQFDALSTASSGQLQRISIELGSPCTINLFRCEHFYCCILDLIQSQHLLCRQANSYIFCVFRELKMEHIPAVD